ncbi:MAG: hypothetical protein V4543_00515 [Bacteroidota bacterium]
MVVRAQTNSGRIRIDNALNRASAGKTVTKFENFIVFDSINHTAEDGYFLEKSKADFVADSNINSSLEFINTTFEETGLIRNLVFKKHVWFRRCLIPKGFRFKNCKFLDGLTIENSHIGHLNFDDCLFMRDSGTNQGWSFGFEGSDEYFGYTEFGYDSLNANRHFSNCTFADACLIRGTGAHEGQKSMSFQSCKFTSAAIRPKIESMNLSDAFISECIFTNGLLINSLNVSGEFSISQSSFMKSLYITGARIRGSLLLGYKSSFKEYIQVFGLRYDEKVSSVDYDSIRHKLTSVITAGKPYMPNTDSALANTLYYKELITTLYNLHSLYKSHGDIESANNVYIDIRDYETNMLEYKYHLAPSLDTYFDWKMNTFLRTFCLYGTKPVLSLKYAFYTMLLFALLYFIFPSEPDNLSSKRMVPAFEKLLHKAGVLETGQPATALVSDEAARLKTLLEISAANKKVLPAPLYHTGRLLLNFSYRYFSFISRVKLPSPNTDAGQIFGRKWTAYAFTYIILFLISGIFMRLLNATALSLNAFVTLGYGEMQARGIARYLVVLEGAIGWFLLGIFSVSLISQILG